MNRLAQHQPYPSTHRYEQLRARHQICCPSRLAADYCDFARAEARRIWRDNAPRKYYIGDNDDAECVGLGALMRSAQIWPPKCPRCEGAGRLYDLMAGAVRPCDDCAGSGRPRDERNVFHAYLRLAIRTQVMNELKRRSRDARSVERMGKRERSASGNFRVGRGPMRDHHAPSGVAEMGSTSSDGTAGPGLGLRVWTTSDNGISVAKLSVLKAGAVIVLDISDATGYSWLRPSDKLRLAYPKRCLQPAPLWEKFVEAYKAELRRSMRANVAEWGALLARRAVVLRCDCTSMARCHRGVLAEVLVGTRGVYEGELSAPADVSRATEDARVKPAENVDICVSVRQSCKTRTVNKNAVAPNKTSDPSSLGVR